MDINQQPKFNENFKKRENDFQKSTFKEEIIFTFES